jgi:type IV secretion system protein VirD4
MTRSTSGNSWRRPLICAAAIVALVAWSYLAGGIFLVAHGRTFDEATPLTYFQYWAHYGSSVSTRLWLWIAAGAALALLVAPAIPFLIPAQRSLFGDARFATRREIKRAGLLGDKGIIVGQHAGRYLVFGGSQHVIMSAPTRSGKGVGIAIPNLLSWPDSVVVLDVKQENHAITSRYRNVCGGQPCYLFNPAATDYRTHRYNPLHYVSDDPNFRIDDVQKIAGMLFPDIPGTDAIWTATPRTLFMGIVLYLLETPGKLATIGQVLRETLVDGDGSKYFASVIAVRALGERVREASRIQAQQQAERDAIAVLADKGKAPEHHSRMAEMAVWAHLSPAYREALEDQVQAAKAVYPGTPDLLAILASLAIDKASAEVGRALSGACVRALNAYTSIASENTRAGVMTSFRSRLELWNNPLVDAATSGNDFDLRDVRRKRMSIYLGVTPDNLDRMAPLLNLFFQQLIDLNTRELPEHNPTLRYQCLLLTDEFTAMGRIGVLSKGISYIAGYGLRMLPIIQSPAQLVEVYGREAATTFTTNHALQIVFPPKATEVQTAKDISEWLGYQTVKGTSESKAKAIFARRERTVNTSDQRRALLLPQEITGLGKDSELVVVEDCPPILANKIRYYADHTFVDRLKDVSPTLASLGRKLPSESELKQTVKNGELAARVPRIDLDGHQARVASGTHTSNLAAGHHVSGDHHHAADDADLPALDKTALASFQVDFSGVPAPESGTLDREALHAYADALSRKAGIPV